MKKKVLRLFVVSLILSSTVLAPAEPITKTADASAQNREEQAYWMAKKETVKSFKGKKVLIRMIVRANALEMVLTGTVSYEKRNVLSPPSRLEIDIPHAANALGADMIDINKIGIAKVLFVNNDDFLRVIVVPTEGTPLPSRIEATHNSRGLLINMAPLPTEPYSAPVIDKPVPAASALPTHTVTQSTPAAKSTPSPIPVTTAILSDKVAPVATPRAKPHEYLFLVVGESVNRKKLDAVVKKVRAAGVKPDVTAATKQVEVFRLLVASYAETKPAELRRAQVALHTRNAFIARDGDSYCVCAGSLMSEDSARREQKRLATKGLEGLQIVRVMVPLKVWRVTAGGNADVRQTLKLLQTLTKRGIKVSSSEFRIVETGT